MISDLQTKNDFEKMFVGEELDRVGDRWFIRWRASQTFRYKRYIKLLKKNIGRSSFDEYLEIGCAQGNFLKLFLAEFPWFKATATDISSSVIDWDKKHIHGVEFHQSELPEIGGDPEHKYDLISALEVLYYLDRDKQSTAIQNMSKRLKSGGLVMLSGGLDGGNRYWDERWITDLVSKFLQIKAIDYHYAKLYTKIERPILKIFRLSIWINAIADLDLLAYQRWQISATPRQQYLSALVRKGGSGLIMQCIAKIGRICSRHVLGWQWLPWACSKLTRVYSPVNGKSHIVILAKKGANE